jgi:hypothetical protein
MPCGVVDGLEGVEIEKQDSYDLLAMGMFCNRLVDMVDEVVTIGKPGQRIINLSFLGFCIIN